MAVYSGCTQWLYTVVLYGGSIQWLYIVAVYSGSIQWFYEHDAENPGSENVDVALRHEAAQLLSLCWVAHGSATVVHAHLVAHPNFGHVGATGCGCRFHGCRCAHAGATGCQ